MRNINTEWNDASDIENQNWEDGEESERWMQNEIMKKTTAKYRKH